MIKNEQLKFCGIIWCAIRTKYHLRKLGAWETVCGSFPNPVVEMKPQDPPEDADFCKTCLTHYRKQFGE
jgi:hypothetical protein